MLDLSKPLTAGKIKEYFKEEYGAAENSYFSQGGTIRGEWQGELVNTFGLSGPVEGEAFLIPQPGRYREFRSIDPKIRGD